MIKKEPLRKCVVTQERLPKKELIRIVKNKEQEVFVDLQGKQNGKGAYIKKDLQVLEKAIKSKALERNLEIKIPDTIYEELRTIIGG